MHIHEREWNIMLHSAQQQGACLHYDGCWGESFNCTPPLHTVCCMEPNKLECQSQTHLGARCRISDYINQWYCGWMGTQHCDGFSPSADKVRRVWYGVNLITEWEWLTLYSTSMEVLLSKALKSKPLYKKCSVINKKRLRLFSFWLKQIMLQMD